MQRLAHKYTAEEPSQQQQQRQRQRPVPENEDEVAGQAAAQARPSQAGKCKTAQQMHNN